MKASVLYRISAILLLVFAAGHTAGLLQVDPIESMKTVHINVLGSERSYWDFFVGFGLVVTALLVFAAIVAWQFGRLPSDALAAMRFGTWGFAVSFAAVAYLSVRYFFILPIVLCVAIFLCLTAAAWVSGRR